MVDGKAGSLEGTTFMSPQNFYGEFLPRIRRLHYKHIVYQAPGEDDAIGWIIY